MTSVWDPCLAAIYDGGDDYCIIDSNLCVNREILVTKHVFSNVQRLMKQDRCVFGSHL